LRNVETENLAFILTQIYSVIIDGYADYLMRHPAPWRKDNGSENGPLQQPRNEALCSFL
jgi:hypothetical protein